MKDVKTLINEAKREGRIFTLNKDKKKKKASPFLTPRPLPPHEPVNETIDENLISAMTQLAWERDLDLVKAKARNQRADIIGETDLTQTKGPLLSSKGKRSPPSGIDNPAMVADVNTNNNNDRRSSGGNASARPRLRSSKVAPDTSSRPSSREGSGGSGSSGNKVRPGSKGWQMRTPSEEKDDQKSPEDKPVFAISGSLSTTSLTSLLNNTWETKTEDTNV